MKGLKYTVVVTASLALGASVQHYMDARLVADVFHSDSLSISDNVIHANALLDVDDKIIRNLIPPSGAVLCHDAGDEAVQVITQ